MNLITFPFYSARWTFPFCIYNLYILEWFITVSCLLEDQKISNLLVLILICIQSLLSNFRNRDLNLWKTEVLVLSQRRVNPKTVLYAILRNPPLCCCCSVARSCPTLQLHGLWHSRLFHPSLSPGVCSHSGPLSGWCYLTILFSFSIGISIN